MTRIPLLMAVLALPVPISAQFENPEDRVRELAQEIADELVQIDQLLLQTGQAGNGAVAADAMRENVKRIDELLKQTSESQGIAVQRIDELIKELEKMGGT